MNFNERLKKYELEYRLCIPKEKYIIVRIDGHKFSRFTKAFKKPFDEVLSTCMIETTKFLMERTNAITGYTQSDEITLVLAPSFSEKDNYQIFNGRIDKIISLTASFATQIFNKLLFENLDYITQNPEMKTRVLAATFDSRVFAVDSKEEVFNSVLVRMRNAEKNSRSVFAQTYCDHKKLLNKTSKEQTDFCLKETNKDWNKISNSYKYGVLIKKEFYVKNNSVVRTRFRTFSKKFCFSTENVELVCINKISNNIVL
jgi:tRNA(His) 5'-end guanylyltransferase